MRSLYPCGVCDQNQFAVLWELPQLPLTECFGHYDAKFLGYDQSLLVCENCSHVQLAKRLPPKTLYTPNDYTYRTSQASATPKRIESFVSFCKKHLNKYNNLSVVDIGGNDQILLKNFDENGNKLTLIDPIRNPDNGKVIDNIYILGKFVNEVNFSNDISIEPDLIVCAHTLEHIETPIDLLTQLFAQCSEECVFVFEVPCLDAMLDKCRLDAVFHQHLHYFSYASLDHLITKAGGHIIAYDYNQVPTLGGSIMVAFKQGSQPSVVKRQADSHCLTQLFSVSKLRFDDCMTSVRKNIDVLSGVSLYGYGASLMLPTLLYHLKLNAELFTCILDDDPNKKGLQYKNLNIKIEHPASINIDEYANYLITSIENCGVLVDRIESFRPNNIYIPMVTN